MVEPHVVGPELGAVAPRHAAGRRELHLVVRCHRDLLTGRARDGQGPARIDECCDRTAPYARRQCSDERHSAVRWPGSRRFLMLRASVNGTELAFVDVGPRDGVPIVFSHSLFFDHTMFDALVQKFADDGYRVVAYDHRGQGESAPAARDELAVDVLAEDAAALIEHLDLAPCHVVGNSLGGFVALRLAARRPELLRTAAALGSSAEEEYKLDEFAPLVGHLTEHGTADVVDTIMYIMFGDSSLAQESAMTSTWRAAIARLGPRIGDAAHGVIHRGRIVEELAGCRVPVLAVAGREDHAYPPPISSVNIADAAGGRHVTVDAAGHSVALEQPDEVARHLSEHFAPAGRDRSGG
ncbi:MULTISPECIES: alpha/beta fold hydrolase [Rhodococcus]|uniref:alpha/beta fold hydrolase n=1 Tax=Rhodococcus TaxID=1827 RepID=UPI001E315304|nr:MULTISPECIES: alpha/beta fold hydrolase [Rhodococcus]